MKNPHLVKVRVKKKQQEVDELSAISEHLSTYLQKLERNDGTGYAFLFSHSDEFSKEELVDIVLSFDCMLYPKLTEYVPNFDKQAATYVYRLIASSIRNRRHIAAI